MSGHTTLEQRLAVLEQEASALKQQVQQAPLAPDWLARVAGSFKQDQEFDEVLRLGRAVRESQRSQQPCEVGFDL